jgi:phosphate/sulfate permease
LDSATGSVRFIRGDVLEDVFEPALGLFGPQAKADAGLQTAGAALALMVATLYGVPVSTTHAITGAIVGVGATRRLSAVRWGVARQIVWAWVLTIPASAAIGASCYLLSRLVR